MITKDRIEHAIKQLLPSFVYSVELRINTSDPNTFKQWWEVCAKAIVDGEQCSAIVQLHEVTQFDPIELLDMRKAVAVQLWTTIDAMQMAKLAAVMK